MDTWRNKSFAFCGKRLCSLAWSDFRRQVGRRHKPFDLKRASSQVPVSPFHKQTTNFSGKASWGTSPLSAVFFKLCHLGTSLQCCCPLLRGCGGRLRGGRGRGFKPGSERVESTKATGWQRDITWAQRTLDKQKFECGFSSLLVQLVQKKTTNFSSLLIWGCCSFILWTSMDKVIAFIRFNHPSKILFSMLLLHLKLRKAAANLTCHWMKVGCTLDKLLACHRG